MLGIRIGEVLALRTCDVQLAASPPRVTIGATLVNGDRGEPVWQGHPKAQRQTRELVLPSVAIAALQPYLRPEDPTAPLFPARNGGWLRAGNVRRVLHSFRDERGEQRASVGIDSKRVIPHLFRSTLATMIASEQGVDRAKEQLGHASIQTTERHYVTPPSIVGLSTAELVNRAFGSAVPGHHRANGDASTTPGAPASRDGTGGEAHDGG